MTGLDDVEIHILESHRNLRRENDTLRHGVRKLLDNMDELWGRGYRAITQFKDIIEELEGVLE